MRRMITAGILLAMLALSAAATPGGAATHIVCPADTRDASCRFKGGGGIQEAVDAAKNGDVVLVKAGRYTAAAYRDVPSGEQTIRGFVVLDRKNLTLRGEPGAILDGGAGLPTAAIVVHRADVTISKLTITGFRYDVEEDEIYEGHGVFVIDSKARIDDVTISKFQKMGLTGRGESQLDVTNLRVLDGHVAIWLYDSAHVRMRNSLIRGNDSAGIAAYDKSIAHVSNSVFDGNLDDGLYSEHEAAIHATNSLFLRNKPFAVRATGESRISVAYSGLFANAGTIAPAKDGAVVTRGANVIEGDPKVDANYRLLPDSPLAGKGDPELAAPGAPSQIGLVR